MLAFHRALVCCAILASANAAHAQTSAPIQSKARPYGLEIVDTVKIGGSDSRSAEFKNGALPGYSKLTGMDLSKPESLKGFDFVQIDPSKIQLFTDSNVRAYFVGEDTSYRNSVGINTQGNGIANGDPKLLFPDASTNKGVVDGRNGKPGKGQKLGFTLEAGDFVDLGNMKAGTNLDFFLIAQGASQGKGGKSDVYSAGDPNANYGNGLQHVMAFVRPDSPYLILAFEDSKKLGDRDYSDLVLAIDIGKANIKHLTSAPEPGTFAVFGSFLVLAAYAKRRRARTQTENNA